MQFVRYLDGLLEAGLPALADDADLVGAARQAKTISREFARQVMLKRIMHGRLAINLSMVLTKLCPTAL